MKKLTNIPLRDFRKYLDQVDCNKIRTSGGHEIWARKDLTRNITIQTHIDPVPVHIIKNTLKNLNVSSKEFLKVMDLL